MPHPPLFLAHAIIGSLAVYGVGWLIITLILRIAA